MDRFQILSIDGGGSRGLFAAAVLAAAEDDLGTRIVDHFDLLSGTSTGGIIAIALGLGFTPREIVDFYVDHSPGIFRNPFSLRSLQQWVIRKYPRKPLERALRNTFQQRGFGESTKRLVIPSYNLGADDVYIFRTAHHERLKRDFKVPAWQVAAATTAAPTFFSAFRGVQGLRLIDGGVWANNPAMVAVVEAVGTLSVDLSRIAVLSIGTYEGVSRRPRWLNAGGRLPWALKATDVLLRATSLAVNNQVKFLLGEDRFLRLDPKVAESEVALDRIDTADDLIGRAQHYSRHAMPKVEAMFMRHRAVPFVPIHVYQ
jgi:uncharacterized protein